MYIPLAAILMEIFEMPEMVNRSKNTKDAGMLKSLDFKFEIKCPNTHLQTKIYQVFSHLEAGGLTHNEINRKESMNKLRGY